MKHLISNYFNIKTQDFINESSLKGLTFSSRQFFCCFIANHIIGNEIKYRTIRDVMYKIQPLIKEA